MAVQPIQVQDALRTWHENWITQIYLNCEKKRVLLMTHIRCQANFSFLYFSFRLGFENRDSIA